MGEIGPHRLTCHQMAMRLGQDLRAVRRCVYSLADLGLVARHDGRPAKFSVACDDFVTYRGMLLHLIRQQDMPFRELVDALPVGRVTTRAILWRMMQDGQIYRSGHSGASSVYSASPEVTFEYQLWAVANAINELGESRRGGIAERSDVSDYIADSRLRLLEERGLVFRESKQSKIWFRSVHLNDAIRSSSDPFDFARRMKIHDKVAS